MLVSHNKQGRASSYDSPLGLRLRVLADARRVLLRKKIPSFLHLFRAGSLTLAGFLLRKKRHGTCPNTARLRLTERAGMRFIGPDWTETRAGQKPSTARQLGGLARSCGRGVGVVGREPRMPSYASVSQ